MISAYKLFIVSGSKYLNPLNDGPTKVGSSLEGRNFKTILDKLKPIITITTSSTRE